MKQHIRRLSTAIRKIHTLKIIQRTLIAIILILTIVLIVRKPSGSNKNVIEDDILHSVSMATVAELSSSTSPLVVTGTVQSQTEAVARAETQGQIVIVYYGLGDRITRGAMIASVENSRERALVAQAEATLEQAKAGLGQAGTISAVNLENSKKILEESANSGKNTVSNAFSIADDAVRNRADLLFFNPQTSNPKLKFQVPTSQQLQFQLESERPNIESTLTSWSSLTRSLATTPTEIIEALQKSESHLKTIKAFLDQASLAVNSLTPNSLISEADIASWRGNISAARSSASTVLPSVTGALTSIRGATTALEIAEEDFAQNQSGRSGTTASATLAQAGATLQSARASLDKTIISAPVSGVITQLDIDQGDFVSLAQPVATISNTQAFEIVTYLTERDARDLAVGTPVTINNLIGGKITTLAPRIDAQTKKREVIISVEDETSLLNGQSVRIAILRNGSFSDVPEYLFVPLSALKVTSEGVVTLTVNSENSITYLPVTIGPLTGEKVLILGGLKPEDRIITDVRGLLEGDKVTVSQ